jgi:hypothetical protein
MPGANKYSNGILFSDGKIYCGTWASGNIGVIDVDARTFTAFGSGITNGGGIILTPNGYGHIICAQNNRVLYKVDLSAQRIITSVTLPGNGTYPYSTGFLGTDGYVYMFGFDSNIGIRINPSDDSATAIGSGKSTAATLGLDGYGYRGYSTICRIDLAQGSMTAVAAGYSRGYNGFGTTDDGRIILSPHHNNNQNYIEIFNPVDNTKRSLALTGLPNFTRTTNFARLADGNYYGYCSQHKKIIRMRNDLSFDIMDLPAEVVPSATDDSAYAAMTIDAMGRGVLIPCSSANVIVIDTGCVLEDQFGLPDDLSDLPGSLFNKYYNHR